MIKNLTVIKRDNRRKPFSMTYIQEAIRKAYLDVRDEECFESNYIFLEPMIEKDIQALGVNEIEVEKIQDIIVNCLMNVDKIVAKSYEDYRNERSREREHKMKLFDDIKDVLDNCSPEARENANKAGDKIQSIRAMVSDIATREYNEAKVIPDNLLKEHKKRIYIHDEMYFGLPFHNCFLINWRDMLDNGFHIDGTYVKSPNSLRTAVTLLSQIVARCASNCYGGVSLADVCIGLEKYAQKSFNKHLKIAKEENVPDKEGYAWRRLKKEAYDSFQDLLYSINCLCTSRGEVPFVTVSYGLSTTKFGRLIQNSILDVRIDGFEGGVSPVFPKEIFVLKKGVNLNPEDPNYDIFKKAVLCSALRIYPDYISYDKVVEVTGDYKTCMSCRSFLGSYKDENGKYITDGRFNIGVMSINLPRLAITSNGDEKEFYRQLDECLELCRQGLMFRYNIMKNVKAKQANILWTEGAIARLNPEDTIEPLLQNGYCSLSIGYIGISNVIKSLYGVEYSPKDEISIIKGKQIMNYMKNYCDRLKKETGLGFSLYSTPFETGATKLCKADQKEFGIIEGVNSKGYYENSFHFDSDKDITPFDKIDFESNFMGIASGGAIQYTEYPNMLNNLEALEDVIRYAYDKVHYFGINTKPDVCLKCGYHGEVETLNETDSEFRCPDCGNTDNNYLSVIRRLCGYTSDLALRKSVDNKMKEINHRHNNFKK